METKNSSDENTVVISHSSPTPPRIETVQVSAPSSRTPVQTVIDFEGNVTRVRTHRLIGGRCSKNCLAFFFHTIALSILLVVGLVMAIISGFGSVPFGYWSSLFTFAVGGFLPNPKIKKADINVNGGAYRTRTTERTDS